MQLQPSKQLLSNGAKQIETDPPKAQAHVRGSGQSRDGARSPNQKNEFKILLVYYLIQKLVPNSTSLKVRLSKNVCLLTIPGGNVTKRERQRDKERDRETERKRDANKGFRALGGNPPKG